MSPLERAPLGLPNVPSRGPRRKAGPLLGMLLALALAPALTGASAHAAPAPAEGGAAALRLDPARLVAVIAGVLEWKDPALPPFSKHHRKDVELDALLAERGVPAERRTLLLDEAATAKAVKAALARAIAATGPGDTLLFYFDGHGVKHPGGKIIFATADTRARAKSGLHLDELPPLFKGRFKGARVLLLADCCHSGGLTAVAAALAAQGIATATLTSAEMSNTSTANWTFTQALLDCLRGSPLCDANADGVTTLGEARGEARETLLHREQQVIGWANHGVPEGLVLAETRRDDPDLAPGQPRRGEWVVVDHDGRSWPARILGARGDALRVSLYDYSDELRLTVPAASVRTLSFQRWPVGAALDVLWNGETYLARVEKVDGGLHFITYPGWPREWDEWVGPDRIVGEHRGDAPAVKPVVTPAAPEKVEVEWKGKWWPAEVTGARGGKTCIHYTGFDASWDECVPTTRLRRAAQ